MRSTAWCPDMPHAAEGAEPLDTNHAQVSAFLQAGLAGAGAHCSSTCANPFAPATVGPVLNRSSAAKAAEKVCPLPTHQLVVLGMSPPVVGARQGLQAEVRAPCKLFHPFFQKTLAAAGSPAHHPSCCG